MNIIKPPRLRRGDVIGVCAPAGPILDRIKLDRGIRYLEQLGYQVHLGNHLYKKMGYLAGTDAERAGDLTELFADKHVRAVFCARGGYGIQRILPLLDYKLIRRNPKIVVGYSDITALQLALFRKIGLITFAGPMVVGMPDSFSKSTEEMFWRMLTSILPPEKISATESVLYRGPRTVATGRLVGGNLALVAALVGTPFLPDMSGTILSLEEIDEQPYRVDRLLQQLDHAGVLSATKGVLLGTFTGCVPDKGKPSLRLPQIFERAFKANRTPVVSGFRFGHVRRSLTLPIGANVRIDGTKMSLQVLDAGVS